MRFVARLGTSATTTLPLMRTLLGCTLLLCILQNQPKAQSPSPENHGQVASQADCLVLWQRTLEDSQALAKATGKPLLLALNMDGESASDRIFTELYRDPQFVALTRQCVCVIGSVFRHNARDHDELGRRILCPRCSNLTCGEHMAVEPALFARYLADGERVAPRHALILPNGNKAFDLSLCFDLHDIERALAKSLSDPAAVTAPNKAAQQESQQAPTTTSWQTLATGRDQAQRSLLEQAITNATDEPAISAALTAIAAYGDRGSIEALHLIAARLPQLSTALRRQFLATVRDRQLESAVAAVLLALLRQFDAGVTIGWVAGHEALLPLLAELDGSSTATRTLLLAYRCVAEYAAAAAPSLEIAFGDLDAMAIERALQQVGGEVSLLRALTTATANRAGTTPIARDPNAELEALPSATLLTQTREALALELRGHRENAQLLARHATASLALARRRIASQESGAPALLDDAEQHFAAALDRDPAHILWWNDRARTAFLRERWHDQASYGQQALTLAQEDQQTTEPTLLEALRWTGDGCARQIGAHAIDDPAREIEYLHDAMASFARVITSPLANDNDYSALASICGLLGLWREQAAIAADGARHLPASPLLRQCLTDAARWAGRPDLLPTFAVAIENATSSSADSAWFLGQARVLAADAARRACSLKAAEQLLIEATVAFQHCAKLAPAYAATCAQQLAIVQLGTGMTRALAGQQAEAVAPLLLLAASDLPLESLRDGCDCDLFDLVDRILEWRASGSSPVDPELLLSQIEQLGASDPIWPVALADALLREALRADGRNQDRVLRDTVSASGKQIQMPLGKPTGAGDRYLLSARAIARRAAQPNAADLPVLVQVHAIWAERLLERGRTEDAAMAIAEAALLLGMTPPNGNQDLAALRAALVPLREKLGPARPRERFGR